MNDQPPQASPSQSSNRAWCGRCHQEVERERGSGTAWTLWVCPKCRGSLGVRIKPEDIGPVDVDALDTDYEPITLRGGR